MYKRVNMKIAIPVMVGILILLIALKATGLMPSSSGVTIGFVGNTTLHTYSGTYAKIKGTHSHILRPSKGSDTVHCEIKTREGEVHVEISEKDSKNLLMATDVSDDETFDVKASGKVRITLVTDGHSGSYLFKY
ncbi:MAG: hypothetical protein K6E56_03955 [Lachnospiraceae bacterium]|nr:hypothetical protein [Lachnospiraceae bacterium]